MNNNFIRKKILGIEVVAELQSDFNKVAVAILYLKRKYSMYFNLIKKIKGIYIYPKLGYDNEFFPDKKKWVCELKTVRESSIIYLASLLVHEAIHLRQYKHGLIKNTKKTELEAYETQRKFLNKAGDKKSAQWIMKQYRENWTKYRYKDTKQFLKPSKKFKVFLDSIGSSKKLYSR